MPEVPLYEHPIWQSTPDQVMRPGGLTITEQALSHCDMQPDSRLLDLGCGMGTTLKHIGAMYQPACFGVDISKELLSRASRSSSKASFTQAKSECLPFASESMDVILSECTLSIFETDITLEECARMLKPGGYFVVNDLYARDENGMESLRQLPPGTCIRAAMSQRQILEKLRHCGMTVRVWQDCSERLKGSLICTLATAAEVNPFDLHIAAARAKLGYYFLVARKERLV